MMMAQKQKVTSRGGNDGDDDATHPFRAIKTTTRDARDDDNTEFGQMIDFFL